MRTQILFSILAVAPLCAGVRILSETQEHGSGSVSKQEVLVDNTRLRMNMTGKQNMSILFLTAGGNRLVMIDRARKEYREIDQAQMNEMSQQMQRVMSAMTWGPMLVRS